MDKYVSADKYMVLLKQNRSDGWLCKITFTTNFKLVVVLELYIYYVVHESWNYVVTTKHHNLMKCSKSFFT